LLLEIVATDLFQVAMRALGVDVGVVRGNKEKLERCMKLETL